ncbi:MAG: CBS domain-containing protein [Arhodomonas sp.]|nr:CBS domain-containing protein [Arhodomonas sp.]
MTPGGHTITRERLAAEALALMESHGISALPVVDEELRLVGALNMHDLLRAGVV